MAFTTKTIQMTDASGRNISPMVNLESLYYETENDNKIERHFIYENFPIHVNYGNNAERTYYNDLLKSVQVPELEPIEINSDQTLQIKIDDDNSEDMIVSYIKLNKIPGTNYYRIDVSNYNLSQILFNYESKSMANTSINALQTNINTSINIINTSIIICNTSINVAWENIYISNVSINRIDISIGDWLNWINIENTSIQLIYEIGNKVYTHKELKEKIEQNRLIPGLLYRMKYEPNPGPMNATSDKTLCKNNVFDMVLMADTSCSFSEDVVACMKNASDINKHFDNSDLSQWEVKYAFETRKEYPSYYAAAHPMIETRFPWASGIYYSEAGKYYSILYKDELHQTSGDRSGGPSGTYYNINCYSYLPDEKPYKNKNIRIGEGSSTNQDLYASNLVNLNECGVIYYMKDEHGNEAPYDFKNAKVWNWKGASGSYYKYTFDKGGGDDTVQSDTKTKNNIIKESPTLSIYCYSPTSSTSTIDTHISNLYVGYENKDIAIYNSKNVYLGNNNTSVMLSSNIHDNTLYYNSENTKIGNNNSNIINSGYGNEIGNNNDIIVIDASGVPDDSNKFGKFNRIEDNNTNIYIIKGNYNIINSSCNNVNVSTYCLNNILMGNNKNISICGNYNTVYTGVYDSTIGPSNSTTNYVVLNKSNYSVAGPNSNSFITDRTFYAKNYIKN